MKRKHEASKSYKHRKSLKCLFTTKLSLVSNTSTLKHLLPFSLSTTHFLKSKTEESSHWLTAVQGHLTVKCLHPSLFIHQPSPHKSTDHWQSDSQNSAVSSHAATIDQCDFFFILSVNIYHDVWHHDIFFIGLLSFCQHPVDVLFVIQSRMLAVLHKYLQIDETLYNISVGTWKGQYDPPPSSCSYFMLRTLTI